MNSMRFSGISIVMRYFPTRISKQMLEGSTRMAILPCGRNYCIRISTLACSFLK